MSSASTSKKSDERTGFLQSLLLSIGIVVLLAAVLWIASSAFNLHKVNYPPVQDMFFLGFQVFLTSLNGLLQVVLLAQYLEGFLRFKTKFTLAFVILALVLLADSITSSPLFFSLFGHTPMTGPFSIIPLIFTTVAVLALIYLNTR